MPLADILHAAREYARDSQNAYSANTDKLVSRLSDVVLRTWDLGFTAFGGPPVHFQIEHRRFVEGRGGKAPWIDEQIVSLSKTIFEDQESLAFVTDTWRGIVSRALCDMSSFAWAWEYQDVVLHRLDTRRAITCNPRILNLEVSCRKQ
jgi:hypothetical protein